MSSDSASGLIAVSATLLGLSAAAVGLRGYTRKRQHQPWLADDWLAALGVVAYLGSSICIFLDTHRRSLGYSSSSSPAGAAKYHSAESEQLLIAQVIMANSTLAFVKLSAVFFYRRIFCVGVPKDWFDIATRVTIGVVIAWLFVFDFMTGFQCGTHFSALWDGSYAKYCVLSFPVLYGVVISDFLLDIWILVLPIPRAKPSRKLSIIGVFLLAFIGLGASIARLVEYVTIENAGPKYFLTHDQEGANSVSVYLSMLEAGISLVAVNLPSLWKLVDIIGSSALLRSMVSLTSLRSRGSRGSSGGPSQGSTSNIVADNMPTYRGDIESQNFSASATHSITDNSSSRKNSSKQIQVERSWELESKDEKQ